MMNDSTANDDTNKVSMLACVTGVSEEQARQARPLRTSTTTRPAPSLSMSALTESPKETNSTRRDRPSSTVPGAIAVAGPDASQYDNDEYTLTAQTTTSDNVAPQIKHRWNPSLLLHLLRIMMKKCKNSFELMQHQLEQMRRERENVAIAEVIPNDIESPPHESYHGQDTSDNRKPMLLLYDRVEERNGFLQ